MANEAYELLEAKTGEELQQDLLEAKTSEIEVCKCNFSNRTTKTIGFNSKRDC